MRNGSGRSTDDFNQLCDLVTEAWNRSVNDRNSEKRPTELSGVLVIGNILAGTEAGFSLPPVAPSIPSLRVLVFFVCVW